MITMAPKQKRRSGFNRNKRGKNRFRNSARNGNADRMSDDINQGEKQPVVHMTGLVYLQWLSELHEEPAAPPDFMPTRAAPGTDMKIDVLAERYEKGWPLWHKDDAGWVDGIGVD
jgi:hypothetical protein